jgi:hypothetical protein
MIYDDLPSWAKIVTCVLAPPLVALVCWLFGPRLTGPKSTRTRERSWKELWLMLVSSYAIFAVAVLSAQYSEARDRADPSSQLVQ